MPSLIVDCPSDDGMRPLGLLVGKVALLIVLLFG